MKIKEMTDEELRTLIAILSYPKPIKIMRGDKVVEAYRVSKEGKKLLKRLLKEKKRRERNEKNRE